MEGPSPLTIESNESVEQNLINDSPQSMNTKETTFKELNKIEKTYTHVI